MEHLCERDLHAGLQLLRAASTAGSDTQSFVLACITALPAGVLEDHDAVDVRLRSGRRTVIGSPDNCLSAQDSACFDRHFDTHPLVRFHAHQAGQGAHRISDSIPFTRFRETALYDEYYRRIRIDHALALPIQVDADTLVSLVLNRRRRHFSDRDIGVLLGCSHCTVQKHLERNYTKLGVETRTAAVMSALKIELH